jgi:hypothetical protein
MSTIHFDTFAESESDWALMREKDPTWPDREPGAPSLVCFQDEEMVGADDLVEPRETIALILDYPLSQAVEMVVTCPGGFTRKAFAQAVLDSYRRIYAEEAADVGDPGLASGLLNRARSNGRHGIWGHDIEDLFLEGAEPLGDGRYEIIMGS